MSIKNAKLMVSAMGNRIYLGTVSKRDPNVINDNRVDFTDQCIIAMFQHMQGLPKGEVGYDMPGVGRLMLEPLVEAADLKEKEAAQ